jgi:ABC-2 type transport system ATP-binding protein
MGQKLKNYSSGMQVRLAFSIAIKAKNDILIFDEVLAVGDEAFQRKCLDIFEEYKRTGQTVILVTHEMETVRKFCNRAVLLKDGKVIIDGDPREVADEYSRINQKVLDDESMRFSGKDSEASPVSVAVLDDKGESIRSFASGSRFGIDVTWPKSIDIPTFVVNVFKLSGEHITAFRINTKNMKSNHFSIKLAPRLGKGKYFILTEMRTEDDKPLYRSSDDATFTITSQNIEGVAEWSGLTYVEHEIET